MNTPVLLQLAATTGANMNANSTPHNDDDMPAEVDFIGAARGKFYRPTLRLKLPVYLGAEVQD